MYHSIRFLFVCPTENPCLGEKLPRCKAQANLKPERTIVREDFGFVQ